MVGFGLDLIDACCGFECVCVCERERELIFSIELLHQCIHPLHLKSMSVNCYLCKSTNITKNCEAYHFWSISVIMTSAFGLNLSVVQRVKDVEAVFVLVHHV